MKVKTLYAIDIFYLFALQESKRYDQMSWIKKIKYRKKIEYHENFIIKNIKDVRNNDFILNSEKIKSLKNKFSVELHSVKGEKEQVDFFLVHRKSFRNTFRYHEVVHNKKEIYFKYELLLAWTDLLDDICR